MSNIFDTESTMSRLTIHEKLLYAQLLGLFIVGAYYAHFLVNAPPGHHWFHAVVLALILLFASFRNILQRRPGTIVEDERDHAIAALGTHWSNLILWVGLVAIMVMYWDHGGMRSADHVIGLLFHLLLLAAFARIVRELAAYRMAA
jgi:hypothetical protein